MKVTNKFASFFSEVSHGRYHIETNSSLICHIPGHNATAGNGSDFDGGDWHWDNGTRDPSLVAFLTEQTGVPVIIHGGYETYDDCSSFFNCWFKHPWTKVR
jgi:hypothetical protein